MITYYYTASDVTLNGWSGGWDGLHDGCPDGGCIQSIQRAGRQEQDQSRNQCWRENRSLLPASYCPTQRERPELPTLLKIFQPAWVK